MDAEQHRGDEKMEFTHEELEKKINVPEFINSGLMRQIQRELDGAGVYYRIFSRTKSIDSIEKKFKKKQYVVGEKMMQDIIGVRIVVYFSDDIDLCRGIMNQRYILDNEEYDKPSDAEFKPMRINMVYRLPDDLARQIMIDESIPIDRTFEVQIRTVFSEGWHEVEHDLRYKRQEDWINLPEQSRMLNGIFATLVTCDWSILQLFDDVAHEHYMNKNWLPMCINHFRLKFLPLKDQEESKIKELLDQNAALAKAILRFDRFELISLFRGKYTDIPRNLLNVVYVVNVETLNDEKVLAVTPSLIKKYAEKSVQGS